MRKRKRPRFKKFRLALLLLFVAAFVGFVLFAILSERKRVETLAAIAPPPELVFHEELAKALTEERKEFQEMLSPELQAARDTITTWAALFKRKENEIDGEEWDAVLDIWYEADRWDKLSPEDIVLIRDFLDAHQDFLAELWRVAAMGGPIAVVPAYPDELDMEHLRATRDCARLLSLNGVLRARTGDVDMATSNLTAVLQLGDALAREPELMPQLVRFACSGIAYQAIIDAFPAGATPAEEVTRIFYVIQQDPGRAPMKIALEAQRILGVKSLNQLAELGWADRYSKMERTIFFSTSTVRQRASQLIYASPMARPWLNRDIANVFEASARVTEVAHLPYHEARKQYDELDVGFSPYARQHGRATFMVLESQARHEAQLQLLQVGLTLEQLQFSQGHVPPSLDALSAHLPQSVLIDPYTGEPFIYIPGDDTFLLYSVGRNLTDDGGTPDINHGDIVWRATW